MKFLHIMMTAQDQQTAAIAEAYAAGIKYTLVSISETLVMGRNEAGRMVYNGKAAA